MPDVVILLLAASGTALATGIGAIPVFLLGARAERLTPFLLGVAVGVMAVAAIAGLLIPAAQEGSVAEVLAGLAIGVAFLVLVRRHRRPDAGFMGRTGPGTRTSGLVMAKAGFGPARQFWAAVATSAPQPIGALVAFVAVEQVSGLLPLSFAFAAGAMLALIGAEMLPTAYAESRRAGPSAGIALGGALMLALGLVLGV
jgi:zinc transporter, ZIP family